MVCPALAQQSLQCSTVLAKEALYLNMVYRLWH